MDALNPWRLGWIARGAGGKAHMPGQIPTGDIHHLRLTVTDLERSRQFYASLLGFQGLAAPSSAKTTIRITAG
jgi:catechol-2,3-dioxygenase